MPINPNDLRVKKTRRGLREAFIRLILQKSYDAISIQDIATEAETARVTFYRHYTDKEALLTDCLNTLYEELLERIEPGTLESIQAGYSPMIVFYEHIEEQETLYRILFSSRGTQAVIEQLRKLFATQIITELEQTIPHDRLVVPLEIIGHHVASALLGLAIWWLDNNKPYPPQYMAQVSLWLSLVGMVRGWGQESFPVSPPTIPDAK